MEKFTITDKSKLNLLPKTAGVYAFYGKKELIYIGKAINIKNRVKNHFQQPSYRDDLFVGQVDRIGFIETNSEIEALILEANLIKKYQPKYNVVWRDDKNYFYVAISQNNKRIPYIFITHQPKKFRIQNSEFRIQYIGPFVEGTALKKTLRFLRKAFPYYTSDKHSKNKCMYCHLDLCPGPNPNLKDYNNNIKKLILILKGKRNAVLNSLKREMRQLSKKNKFEEAGKIRDRIYNLQQVMSHANVIEVPSSKFQVSSYRLSGRVECYDVSNIQGKFATGSMIVFIDGLPAKDLYRKFKIKILDTPNDIAMLKEVLQRRFSHSEWQYPDVILIDGGKAQLNIAVKSKIQMTNQIQNPKLKLIKIISIAKGRQELWIENKNNPVSLKSLPQEAYNLIKQLDDEAHRFAINYHKKLRKKSLLG